MSRIPACPTNIGSRVKGDQGRGNVRICLETMAGCSDDEELAMVVLIPTKPRASKVNNSGKATLRRNQALPFAVPSISELLLNIVNLLV